VFRFLGVTALCASAAVIAAFQHRAASHEHRVKETSDVYVLPPPEETVLLSLGWRAALADLLWSHVLVSQGLHTMEKRRYEHLTVFLDTINALDPQFREPYLFTDALVTFQGSTTPEPEIRKAREIMERGVKARPNDAELWLVLGQFVGFIAPSSYLSDPEEQARWRADGAPMLARAAELGGDDAHISWQAIGGAGIFHRIGQRDASIRFLQRTLAVTDDDELKEKIRKQLDAMLGERAEEAYKQRDRRFMELWRRDVPFVDKTTVLLLGPPIDPARCAGGQLRDDPACALTWKEWSRRIQSASP
jgi:hypothetical protein